MLIGVSCPALATWPESLSSCSWIHFSQHSAGGTLISRFIKQVLGVWKDNHRQSRERRGECWCLLAHHCTLSVIVNADFADLKRSLLYSWRVLVRFCSTQSFTNSSLLSLTTSTWSSPIMNWFPWACSHFLWQLQFARSVVFNLTQKFQVIL